MRLANGKSALAKELGISRQAVHQWPDDKIPAHQVMSVYRVLGGKVTPHQLNPELYPDPDYRPRL